MLYSLKQVVLDADRKRRVAVTRYITVAAGLSWRDAKARRNQERTLSIVPERARQ